MNSLAFSSSCGGPGSGSTGAQLALAGAVRLHEQPEPACRQARVRSLCLGWQPGPVTPAAGAALLGAHRVVQQLKLPWQAARLVQRHPARPRCSGRPGAAQRVQRAGHPGAAPEPSVHAGLDAGGGTLTVPLVAMAVPHAQQRACDLDGEVHCRCAAAARLSAFWLLCIGKSRPKPQALHTGSGEPGTGAVRADQRPGRLSCACSDGLWLLIIGWFQAVVRQAARAWQWPAHTTDALQLADGGAARPQLVRVGCSLSLHGSMQRVAVVDAPPLPMRLLSRLPPVLKGGPVDTGAPRLGARPMLPMCPFTGSLHAGGTRCMLKATGAAGALDAPAS